MLSGWNAAHTVYTAYYNVANLTVDPSASVDVTVSGAKDTHGNVQTPNIAYNNFVINVTAVPPSQNAHVRLGTVLDISCRQHFLLHLGQSDDSERSTGR